MSVPCRLRKAVPLLPLASLAFSACGIAPQDASSDAPAAPAGGSTLARLADGGTTSCPSGGNVLKYGIDKNGNGKLEDSEVLGTFDICNGTSGTLTKISNVSAGTQCAQGGVLVQSGPDTNNNGTLDDSEVASSTPICGAGGQITTVLGSINIQSDEDLARYAATETVSGYVNFYLVNINGTVSLPKLRSVGMDLYVGVESGNNGPGFFGADAAQGAHKVQKLHALGSIPTDTVTASFPALQSVGGKLGYDYGARLSVPALTTVGTFLDCNDPNATFPALVSLGSFNNNNCGDTNALFAQLASFGSNYYASGASFTNNKLTSVGVSSYYGNTYWNSTLAFVDTSSTSVSMPSLTQAGTLLLGGVYANNATLSLPALATVGTLLLAADADPFDFHLTPATFPYATVTTAPLTVKGYALEQTNSQNGGYASVIGQLQHVGGALEISYAPGVTAVNANNLLTAGGIAVFGDQNLTKVAFPQLASLTLADPNFQTCNNGTLGGSGNVNCNNGDDPNDLAAAASIVVQSNAALTSADFGQVSSIPGGLYLIVDPALTEVTGLSHLTKLGAMSQITGVGVTNLAASLVIYDTGLTDLSAFASITSAPGTTGIINNPNLTDITALHLTGSSDTCPVVRDNSHLPYCQAFRFIKAYNADCTLESAAILGLKDPCDPNPCTGSATTCVPNCDASSSTGYTCN